MTTRWFFYALYAVTQSAVKKSATGFAFLTLLLATGASLLAVARLSPDPNSTLVIIGLVLVSAGLVVALFRAWPDWWKLAVPLVPMVAGMILPMYLPGTGGWEVLRPVLSVGAVILGSLLIGVVIRESSPPSAAATEAGRRRPDRHATAGGR